MASLHPYREWSSLPCDLLEEIIIKFNRLTDCMRFGEVCKHWNHAYMGSQVHLKQDFRILKVSQSRNKLPMLIFKTNEHSNDTRGLFSVTEGITYNVQLPIPDGSWLFGSSLGWLFRTNHRGVITLVNPFTNGSISLPLYSFSDEGSKGLLSSDPYLFPDNYEVVILYGFTPKRLAYYKSEKTSWKIISLVEFHICDVIFYKNNVYAVSIGGELMKINFDGEHEKVVTSGDMKSNYNCLVKSLYGDLLLVTRSCVCTENVSTVKICQTSEIKVFKLSNPNHNGLGKWVQVDNIGEQALFVDRKSSVSVSILKFPYFLSNSIHFFEQRYFHQSTYNCPNIQKSCVFSLNDESFIYRDFLDPHQKHALHPTWFVPTLRDIEKQFI